MTVDQIVPLLQDAACDRGFLLRFAQHLKTMQEELSDLRREVTRHGEDHEQIIEAFGALKQMFASLQQRKEEPVSTVTAPQLPPISQGQWEEMLNGLAPTTQALGALAVPTLPHEPDAVGGAFQTLLEGPASEDPVAIQALHAVFETMQRLIAFLAVERAKDREIEVLRGQVQAMNGLCGQARILIRKRDERIQQLEKK